MVAVTFGLAIRPNPVTWVVGALIMAGLIVGGILSRTAGLFGVKFPTWPPDLVVAIVLEAAYLIVFAMAAAPRLRRFTKT